MATQTELVNDLFVSQSGTAEGRTKIAEISGAFIRDKLRELSFARKVIPTEKQGRADCQVSEHHDLLHRMVAIEPKSRAMPITFRGQPTANIVTGKRYPIGFFTIASQKFEAFEQELMVHDFNITKLLEENSTKDIQEIEDHEFLSHSEACIQARQHEANADSWSALTAARVLSGDVIELSVIKGELAKAHAAGADWTAWPIQKGDLVGLYNLIDGSYLRAELVLIHEVDFNNVMLWTAEDVHEGAWEMTKGGYSHSELLGRKFVRTIKGDILRPGNIYCYTAPEFLGKFYILNELKFYIDKIGNMLTWWSWEDIGMGFGNIASLVKVELYPGSVTNEQETPGYEAKMPLLIDELGTVNNRVEQGLTFPAVSTF